MRKITAESALKSQIANLAERFGYRVFRLNSGKIKSAFSGAWVQLCPDGTPDLLIIGVSGRVCWIETKAGKNGLEETQRIMISELLERGQAVIIASSPLDFTRWHDDNVSLTLATLQLVKVKKPKVKATKQLRLAA